MSFPSLQSVHDGVLCQNLQEHRRHLNVVGLDVGSQAGVKLKVGTQQIFLHAHIACHERQLVGKAHRHACRHVEIGAYEP